MKQMTAGTVVLWWLFLECRRLH